MLENEEKCIQIRIFLPRSLMNQRKNESLNKLNKIIFAIDITWFSTLLEGKNESVLEGANTEGKES